MNNEQGRRIEKVLDSIKKRGKPTSAEFQEGFKTAMSVVRYKLAMANLIPCEKDDSTEGDRF